MKISDTISYIGVNDHALDLFEGQYEVPNGMAYNSYVIRDEKIAVLDTVDGHFTEEWLGKLEAELSGGTPDYLVIHHMEPDHSAGILVFSEKYPEAKLVASAAAFNMMKNYFGTDFSDRRIVVKEGNELALGTHTLTFIGAPMVHWPEVLMSYEEREGVLFSADAFGKFGALDCEEEWDCEARRYYIGIVGKFGTNVQAVLKKAASLSVRTICPLHGPVLSGDLSHYLSLYDTWSSYLPETKGVLIAYTSVYGNTKAAAELLKEELLGLGVPKLEIFDLARDDMAEAVEGAFRYSDIVLATTTYNGSIFPYMQDFIERLKERNFKNRRLALIENGSWAPTAAKSMKQLLENCEGLSFLDTVTIRGAVNEAGKEAIRALAARLAE